VDNHCTMKTMAAVKVLREKYLWRIFNVPRDGKVVVKGVRDEKFARIIERACHKGRSIRRGWKNSQNSWIWPISPL